MLRLIDCRSIEPTERGFLDRLANAVGGAPTSVEEAAERLENRKKHIELVGPYLSECFGHTSCDPHLETVLLQDGWQS